MDTRFELYCGLCGIIPNGLGYRIVAVNATAMAHAPFLLVASSFYDSASTRTYDGPPFAGDPMFFGPQVQMYKFDLNDEDLTIATPVANIKATSAGDPSDYCPASPDWNSLLWAAWMRDVSSGVMSKAHFTGRNPKQALARFDVPDGIDVVTWRFAVDDQSNVAKFAFTDKGGGTIGSKPAALANVLTMGMTASSADGKITLKIQPSGKSIVLKPQIGRIKAWIINVPLGELVTPGQVMKAGDTNDHFHMYYTMLTLPPATEYLPKLIDGSCGPFQFGGASSPKCPPAIFTSYAGSMLRTASTQAPPTHDVPDGGHHGRRERA
jgi:hypothetical protein